MKIHAFLLKSSFYGGMRKKIPFPSLSLFPSSLSLPHFLSGLVSPRGEEKLLQRTILRLRFPVRPLRQYSFPTLRALSLFLFEGLSFCWEDGLLHHSRPITQRKLFSLSPFPPLWTPPPSSPLTLHGDSISPRPSNLGGQSKKMIFFIFLPAQSIPPELSIPLLLRFPSFFDEDSRDHLVSGMPGKAHGNREREKAKGDSFCALSLSTKSLAVDLVARTEGREKT
jgi:hypothetical protein